MPTDSDDYVARNVDAKLQQVRFFLPIYFNFEPWKMVFFFGSFVN